MKNTVSAIITAGGNGVRFGGDKMLTLINGKPLIIYTLDKFQQSKNIDEIIVLVREKDIKKYQIIFNTSGFRVKIMPAASQRIISLYNGIKKAKGKYVITHDGNRPLTPIKLIDRLIQEVMKYPAVMTAVLPTTTIKYGNNGFVGKSLLRDKTWLAQTPQGFERQLILRALKKAIDHEQFIATDDSEFVTKMGHQVKIIPGDEINIKVTYPQDLVIAGQLLKISQHNYV